VQGYTQAGQTEKAEEFLKSAITANPDNAQAYVLLGALHNAAKRSSEAEAEFKTAIEKAPDNAIGYGALGQFYLQSQNFQAAEKTVREGLKRRPDNSALHLLLAMTLEASEQTDAAIDEYESMFTADPRSTIVANNLSGLLSEKGDAASLDKAYAIASRFRNTDVPQFLDTLGWIEYQRGAYDQALPLLKTAAEKMPNVGVVQYHLAVTYKALGQKDRAIEGLKRAVELLPDAGSGQGKEARAALEQLNSPEPGAGTTN